MRIRGFIHVMQALEPRLRDIVVTGGWAWYLYRKYLTGERSLPGEFTLDVDIVVPRRLTSAGSQLHDLLAGADFEPEMEGEEHPPVTRYSWPSARAPEAVVEFLTPARASGEDATLEVDGVVAQQLRFLDLLLDHPSAIEIDEHAGGETFTGSVQVPRIGYFVLQKALTFGRRRDREKSYKDLFYIFDLADESRRLSTRIQNDILRWKTERGPDWTRQAARLLEENCGSPEADAIGRVIAQIPEEQRPSRRYISGTFGNLVRILQENGE